MKRRTLGILTAIVLAAGFCGGLLVHGRVSTEHAVEAAQLGRVSSSARLASVVDQPGPLRVESVVGAEWQVPRSGLINLDHPKARAAGLEDDLEPIQIYLHAVRHPTRGTFIIDTGVERAFKDDPEHALISGLAAKAMHLELFEVRTDTKTFVEREPQPIAGVLLTHLHLDHISGLRDVPRGTPIYSGPGEAARRAADNWLVKPITDRALEGHAPIRELQFEADPGARFAGVLDLLGDGSLWALWVPGHTPGSVAYLARTTSGPVLFTGDACHTSWGWQHGVEPGSFSADRPESARSLAALKSFVAQHPKIEVRVGHQHSS